MTRSLVLDATSSDPGPGGTTSVVLYWQPATEGVGYNLYRSGQTPPLNGRAPIAQVRSGDALRALVPEGSDEWRLLERAFSAERARPAHPAEAPGDPPQPADPGAIFDHGLTAEQQAIFDILAAVNLRLRLARGWAFIDTGAGAGVAYTYKLRLVLADGVELPAVGSKAITAGMYTLPSAPADIATVAGDSQVLVLWQRDPQAFSYRVRRATVTAGPYVAVHDEPIFFNLTSGLRGEPLTPPRPGYLDFQRWDREGRPIAHTAGGLSVTGPTNGVSYSYQVACCDILGRVGTWSVGQAATPRKRTLPMAPEEVSVRLSTAPQGLALSWRKVTRDVQGHLILDPGQRYDIYRAETPEALDDLSTLGTYKINELYADPQDLHTPTLSMLDASPTLVPPYGEKEFWYRIRCVDASGNASAPSAMVGGRVPDARPPGSTVMKGVEGHSDHITIFWAPNGEPDLAGYQIYRGLCDRGRPYERPHPPDTPPASDFVLVGQVSRAESAKEADTTGMISFEDHALPPGSPLCYAYWVRAFDAAQNLYQGRHGFPASPEEYVCQRLVEETAPPTPVITGLKARDRAVLVEWVASPVQDLCAFHIYRSDADSDPPTFLGCVLRDGTTLASPWTGIQPCCADTPVEPEPLPVRGSFLDQGLEPNHVYWYRVSALDWLGTESEKHDLTRLPAISTFTYERGLPPTPTVLVATAGPGPGLLVTWQLPAGAEVAGALVYRSTAPDGVYRQVSPPTQGTSFADIAALRGVDYCYRVQSIDRSGRLSQPSAPVKYRY